MRVSGLDMGDSGNVCYHRSHVTTSGEADPSLYMKTPAEKSFRVRELVNSLIEMTVSRDYERCHSRHRQEPQQTARCDIRVIIAVENPITTLQASWNGGCWWWTPSA